MLDCSVELAQRELDIEKERCEFSLIFDDNFGHIVLANNFVDTKHLDLYFLQLAIVGENLRSNHQLEKAAWWLSNEHQVILRLSSHFSYHLLLRLAILLSPEFIHEFARHITNAHGVLDAFLRVLVVLALQSS